jgi:acetyltransferase-like isoleucine patch superfamily enzyme
MSFINKLSNISYKNIKIQSIIFSTINFLKSIIFLRYLVRQAKFTYKNIKTKDYFGVVTKINNNGFISIRKYMLGRGNEIKVGHNTHLDNSYIRIVGNNNLLVFEDNCFIGPRCSFWMEGNNIIINIGSGTTFTNDVEINAQEDFSKITIGNDCMFSNHIIIRTSDSHPIYDKYTNERLNPAKSVYLGNHIWIAPHSTIMKGAKIHDNSIIGSFSMVNKEIPSDSLAVGIPARVVKQNLCWTRESLF